MRSSEFKPTTGWVDQFKLTWLRQCIVWRSLHRESCTVYVDLTEKYPVDENNGGFQYY